MQQADQFFDPFSQVLTTYSGGRFTFNTPTQPTHLTHIHLQTHYP
jgi:Colon cancer-associated protein Mic1-like